MLEPRATPASTPWCAAASAAASKQEVRCVLLRGPMHAVLRAVQSTLGAAIISLAGAVAATAAAAALSTKQGATSHTGPAVPASAAAPPCAAHTAT